MFSNPLTNGSGRHGDYELLPIQERRIPSRPVGKGLYKDTALAPDANNIRVLTLDAVAKGSQDAPLRGELKIVNLDECPNYAALSYTWGDPALPRRHRITCNEAYHLDITDNCHAALTSLRRQFGAVTIWVDSICIDQENDDEKKHQLPKMGDVYTWANPTYIWLGPGSEGKYAAMKDLRGVAQWEITPVGVPWNHPQYPRSLSQDRMLLMGRLIRASFAYNYIWLLYTRPKLERLVKNFDSTALYELLSADWITRGWTFQECALSNSIILVCGDQSMTWDLFSRGVQHFLNDRRTYPVAARTHVEIKRRVRSGHPRGGFGTERVTLDDFDGHDVWDTVFSRQDWSLVDERMQAKFDYLSTLATWQTLSSLWKNLPRSPVWNKRAYRLIGQDKCSVSEYYVQWLQVSASWAWLAFFLIALTWAAAPGALAYGISRLSQSNRGWLYLIVAGLTMILGAATYRCVKVAWAEIKYENTVASFYAQEMRDSDRQKIEKEFNIREPTSLAATELVRALRERNVSRPHDKVFSIQAILERMGVLLPEPSYDTDLGDVYSALFTALLPKYPSMLNLLLEAGSGERLGQVPSWVPDWHSIKERAWLPSNYIYGPLYGKRRDQNASQYDLQGNALTVYGVWRGEVDICWENVPPIDPEDQSDPDEALCRMLAHSMRYFIHWHDQVVKSYASVSQLRQAAEAAERNSRDSSDSDLQSLEARLNRASMAFLNAVTAFRHELPGESSWRSRRRLQPEEPVLRHPCFDPDEFARLCEKMTDHLDELEDYSDIPSTVKFLLDEQDVREMMIACCTQLGRKRIGIMTTDGCEPGSGSVGIIEGDKIATIAGVSAPLILREDPSNPGSYRLVGHAFFDHLMDWCAKTDRSIDRLTKIRII